jgi:hypothetical protein
VFYQLATISLLNAFLNPDDKPGLIVEDAGNSILNQLLGVLAIGNGHLLQARFDFGREMNFYPFRLRKKRH